MSVGLARLVNPEERVDDVLLLIGDYARERNLKAERLAPSYQVHCRFRCAPGPTRGHEGGCRALVQTANGLVIGSPLATKTFDRIWFRDERPVGVPWMEEAPPIPSRSW